MIRITIELLPGGSEARKKTIASGIIANTTGAGAKKRADYLYQFAGKTGRIQYAGGLENFPRKSYGVWKLLYRCLNEIFKSKS